MAGYGHFYVTAQGAYTGAAWLGETAQIGVRLIVRSIGDSSGPIVPVVDRGPVALVSEIRDLTLFSVTSTFKCDFPSAAPIDTYDFLDDVAADTHAFLNTIKASQNNLFRWNAIKIAPIEVGTGKYLAPASVYTLKTALSGGVATAMPPQTAVCVSLRSPVLGKRGRGRVYVPALKTGMADTTGKVASGERTNLANAMKQYATDLGNLPGADLFQSRLIVMSAASTTGVLPSEVRVGDQFDVQRRRETDVAENYTIVPLA